MEEPLLLVRLTFPPTVPSLVPVREREGRFVHDQDRSKCTASLALTIPTVTIEGQEWLGRTFIANHTTGAAIRKRSRHRTILLYYSPPYHLNLL